MNLRSLFKVMLAVAILITNSAFKKGDSLQLLRDLNGRSSRNFYKAAGNFKLRVKAGTIASVMDYRRLGSGNYGIQIRLDGPEFKDKPESERIVWIYDWKNRTDDVKACADSGCLEEAKSMAQAGWAQAKVEQEGTSNPPEVIMEIEAKKEAPVKTEAEQVGLGWATPQVKFPEETATAADTTVCTNGWCETKSAPADLKQTIEAIEEALPTSREEELDDIETTEEDLAPSSNAYNPAPGITYEGGATLPKACHHIIDNHGKVGPTGVLIAKAMMKEKYRTEITQFNSKTGRNEQKVSSVFFRNNAMGGMCPAYSKLNEEQKLAALLHMWAALALKETTCDVKNTHKALVQAAGMFTAEKSAALRAARGSACKGDIFDVSVQVSCAVDTEASWRGGLMAGRSLTQSRYFEPLQRWGKYKTRGGKKYTPILQYMKRIKQCEA